MEHKLPLQPRGGRRNVFSQKDLHLGSGLREGYRNDLKTDPTRGKVGFVSANITTKGTDCVWVFG